MRGFLKRRKIILKIYKFVFYVISKLPAKKDSVIFESFHGKQISDNPLALYEYLLKNHPNYKLYWSIDKRYELQLKNDDKKKYLNRFSLKWLVNMARAEYWVINSRLPLWIPKPAHTTYIQTWHGTPLKKLGLDIQKVHMPGTNTKEYKKNFVNESVKWDYLISPNAYSTEIFKRAFGYNGEIIESGYPRNDYLLNNNNRNMINSLKNNMDLPKNKKVLLYAPTWRDDEFYSKGKYKFSINIDLDLLNQKLGDEWIILFRMHYLVAENLNIENYKGFAYDFSNYKDIRDLYLVSDVLITDYSSVFFDYANLNRPMIFYTYDLQKYKQKLRGFYFDLEQDAPGPLVQTTTDLIKEIDKISETLYISEKVKTFNRKFCYLENGRSSERVVNKVFN